MTACLVFGEFAACKSFKSQAAILRSHRNLPGFQSNGSDDRIEIMTVRFPERFDRHNRSVKIQPFDFTIDQRSLSYLNRLAAKCDFIRFSDWNQTVSNSFQVVSSNVALIRTGTERRV